MFDSTHVNLATDQLDILMATSHDAIIRKTVDGIITAWNPGAEQMYGYTAQEAIGQRVTLIMPDDEFPPIMERLQRGEMIPRYETQHRHKDGRLLAISLVVSPLKDTQGTVVGALNLAHDITLQKQALSAQKLLEHQCEAQNVALREQYLRAEKASRLKSEFLANMSHELRTPLNAIIGFADLLAAGIVAPPKEEQKEYLADILSSGRHLLQLVNDVLDLSKIQAGKMVFRPEPVELNALISAVCKLMRPLVARKQLQISTDMDPTVTGVVIDPARFKQVFYNYLSNAIKFTHQEGKIWVRIRAEQPDTFRLEVEDTGIGIDPEDIGRLFVEFQQLDISASKKYQGTGLGLALTKRLIEAQGGQVGVCSQPGQGSTFFAVLPRVASISQEVLAESDAYLYEMALPGAPSILVIEDEAQDQQRLAQVCTEAGYQVEVASTGAQALERCRHTAFAAITLDLILPDMDGWEVLRAIRAGGPNREVPVVVITVIEEKSITAAFTVQGVLTKPILTEEFLHVLDQLKPTAKPEMSGFFP